MKELRLAGVCSIEDGNGFLRGSVEDYNTRFGRAPQSPHDLHRPHLPGAALDDILRLQAERKVSRNLTLHYKRVVCLREPPRRGPRRDGEAHLRDSALSLADIASLLGFPDQSAFTRAFRRWTGVTPGAHRKSLVS